MNPSETMMKTCCWFGLALASSSSRKGAARVAYPDKRIFGYVSSATYLRLCILASVA